MDCIAIYNGKRVAMGYVTDPRQQFKRACQRIADNGAEGVVIDERGRHYEVTRASRRAKPVPPEGVAAVLAKYPERTV